MMWKTRVSFMFSLHPVLLLNSLILLLFFSLILQLLCRSRTENYRKERVNGEDLSHLSPLREKLEDTVASKQLETLVDF